MIRLQAYFPKVASSFRYMTSYSEICFAASELADVLSLGDVMHDVMIGWMDRWMYYTWMKWVMEVGLMKIICRIKEESTNKQANRETQPRTKYKNNN